jgi:uncharacterized delta-60 repeat protein
VQRRRWRLVPGWRGYLEILERRALLSAGDLDLSFGGMGTVMTDTGTAAASVAVQPDGKYVVLGAGTTLARYNVDGTLDTTFGPSGNGEIFTTPDQDAGMTAKAIAIAPDGTMVVAGTGVIGSRIVVVLVRYMPDGSIDTSFGKSGVVTNDFGSDESFGSDVAIQNDGKIIVVGSTSHGSLLPNENFAIARYNSDGSLDKSFGDLGERIVDLGDDDFAKAVAIDYNGTPASNPDYGSIVVGGNKTNNDSNASFAIARLTPNGNLDNSFGNGGHVTTDFPQGADAEARSVAIQPGGAIVAVGDERFPGSNKGDFALARFLPDGTLDKSFGSDGTGRVVTDFGGDDVATSVVNGFAGDLIVGGSMLGIGDNLNRSFAVAAYTNAGVLDREFHGNGVVTTLFNDNGGVSKLVVGPPRTILAVGGNLHNFDLARYIDVGPTISVASLDPIANESQGKSATFLVYRDRRLPLPTDVYLNVEGTARPTIYSTHPGDYTGITILQPTSKGPDLGAAGAANGGGGEVGRIIHPPVPPPTGFVEIPANQTYTVVTITPIDDHVQENNETAIFTLKTNRLYDVGTPQSVTLYNMENDKPVLGDYDADGLADLPVFRSSTAQWFILESSAGPKAAPVTGSPGDIPLQTVFGGGFRTEQTTYNFNTAVWTTRYGSSVQRVQFGVPGDVAVPADYDGDGKTDLAVFRPATNTWYIARSTAGPLVVHFGEAGDIPVPAAYDGNQTAEVAVYRPSTAQFLILQPSGNVETVNLGIANAPGFNGLPGDVPISSDFSGAGRDDPAVYEPATATWRYFDWATHGEVDRQFGAPFLDIPVPRDYDGDGKTDYAVYRPDRSGAGIWLILNSLGGRVQPFGAASDMPVPEPLVYLLRGKVTFGRQAPAPEGRLAEGRAAALAIATLSSEDAGASTDQVARDFADPSVPVVAQTHRKRI